MQAVYSSVLVWIRSKSPEVAVASARAEFGRALYISVPKVPRKRVRTLGEHFCYTVPLQVKQLEYLKKESMGHHISLKLKAIAKLQKRNEIWATLLHRQNNADKGPA
eukprot:807707-Amphidinium_carterae.1